MTKASRIDLREWISTGFMRVEDVAYVGLGLVLAVGALALLLTVAISLGQSLLAGNLSDKIVGLLDQILLILMIVEILYTVQVSFREHTLVAEPFLIVGLIAAVRRVLILTAEFSKPAEIKQEAFYNAMYELALLTALILALVFSIFLVKRQRIARAERVKTPKPLCKKLGMSAPPELMKGCAAGPAADIGFDSQ